MSPRNLTQKVRAILRLGLMEMFGKKGFHAVAKRQSSLLEVGVGVRGRVCMLAFILLLRYVPSFLVQMKARNSFFLVLRGGLFFGLLL